MPDRELLSLLVVEDDEDDFFLTRALLNRAVRLRFDVAWAATYEDGLERLRNGAFDVALVDYRLGAHDGLELLSEAARSGVTTPIILLTGQDDLDTDVRAASAGASDYLIKGGTDAPSLERSIRYTRERQRNEAQIRQQAALLDRASDAIVAFDREGNVVYANESTLRLSGYTMGETMGRSGTVFTFTDPPIAAVLQHVDGRGEWQGELTLRRKDGRTRVVESRWSAIEASPVSTGGYLALLTDVTERKQLETQFLRSQRMESIGRLVGGIAHDLGNLLVPVLLGVKVLQSRLDGDDKAQRTLSMIQNSAQRGSDMVRQVLAFARGVEGERAPMQARVVVEEVEKMARETFGHAIQISVEVEPDLWPLVGDTTQIQQVLMNLCVNARDAMPDGGRLAIEASNVTLDRYYTQRNLDAREGRYVRITVTDTGSGIPPDVLDKIFEPFFTTKAVEKGTGLGLSTVYSIVKSHGGFATVYSELGHGTTFAIYLPAAEADALVHEGAATGDEAMRGNGETILVVDDEPFILETAHDILDAHGYAVLTAANGREGLDLWRLHRDEIALVLTDVMMPEMDGIALIKALREESPDLPILAASGMMGEKADQVMAAGADRFLSKPFTVDRMTATLRELLDRPATPA